MMSNSIIEISDNIKIALSDLSLIEKNAINESIIKTIEENLQNTIGLISKIKNG